MSDARKTHRLPQPRGAAWVGMVMLLGVAAAAYLSWVWAPVYYCNYQAKQVVRQLGNEAVRDPDDDRLLARLVERLRSVEEVEALDDQGRPVRRPAVDVRASDVTWQRIPPTSLRVAFEYAREVEYPWLDRRAEKVFAIDLTMDVSRANWGQ